MRQGIREYLLKHAPAGIAWLSPGDVLLGLREANDDDIGFEHKILDAFGRMAHRSYA